MNRYTRFPLSLLPHFLKTALLFLAVSPSPVTSQEVVAQEAGVQANKDVRLLEPGKPVERELAGGRAHSYQITLAAGQYLNVVVEQRGIDVVVTLSGPDGQKLIEVDSPNGAQGPEPLKWIVETAGIYRIEVRSLENDAKPGRYEAKIVELRAATGIDRDLSEADKLYNESVSLGGKGQYDQALPFADRALALREKTLGEEHPDVAASLNIFARLHDAKSDYAQAEPLYRRALAIREKTLGAEHLDTANSRNSLARLYYVKGDYAQAEPLYRRTLAILEKTLDAGHPDIATLLNNLALLYYAKGDYAQAEPFLRRALTIKEKTLGTEHPDTAPPLNNLAGLYYAKGDYAQAEPLLRRALAIREKTLDAEHPDTANLLNSLATLYEAKGDYAQAESFHRRALAIREKALGAEHHATANSLHNLAALYYAKSHYAQAEMFYRRALTIKEKKLGAEHPETAQSLNNLAALYYAKGDYAQAEPLYRRALAIREKMLGAEHPDTAQSLNNLAALYSAKGEYVQAEPLHRRALAIREKALGAEHPATAVSLLNLAGLHEAKGDISQAVTLRLRAQAIEEHNISANLATGSERQKLAFLATLSKSSNYSVHLHVRSAPDNSAARDLALVAILQRKGRVLDAMNDSVEALRRRANPQDRALFDQLKDARAQLAKLVFGGPQKAAPAEYQQAVKRLEESIEKLEAEIGSQSSEFRAQSQPVTLAAVQSAIPADAVLIEFFAYRPYNAKSTKRDEQYGQPRYVAYVLRQQGEPQWVELGEAKVIDDAVATLRRALRDRKRADVKRLARKVDEQVMRPIRALLGETRRALISPDGALNLVPFAALVDERNRYLVTRYSFSYLTSGRDLLRLQVHQPSRQAPVVVADPAFGELVSAEAAASRDLGLPDGSQQPVAQSLGLAQMYFRPLPGAASEARALRTVLPQATMLTGQQATETALKQVGSPNILHVATHGFFLQDVETRTAGARDFGLLGDGQLSLPPGQFENPLLRSGLALAGANERKSGPNQEDDGVLTALEAAGLDLWGTKLVVLSACDTGVGEVKNGDGVYGLRRALVLAGSESQVMSLWAVSDWGTRDLMVDYYRALQQGQGRGEALRQVQLRMLRNPRRQHPYYWAGFIQSGEWANLDGKR